MKKIFSLFIFIIISLSFYAQNHYWVFFSNKKGSKFNPYEYFDPKAISRRLKNGISLYDSTDFPVNKTYIQKIKAIADSTNTVTRWFNGISIYANKEELSEISKLYFVKSIEPIVLSTYLADYDTIITTADSSLLEKDMEMLEAKKFAEKGINGKGVRIAIFDAGFPGVDVNPVFAHLRKEHKILKTYDFAKKRQFVYDFDSHGSETFSCIAGQIGNLKLGLATEAEFLLARTEVKPEPFSEEENWLAAAEWADKNGADIISSSLGYTLPRYFQYQMDGKSTFVARAAKMASDKGILVVNSMGNDGDSKWKVLSTPADVEEVLSVGGIDPKTGLSINFSSFGPTADGRLKPNVCAAGEALVASPKKLEIAYGTSFSTPLIAGFAACVMQLDTNLSGQKLKMAIEKSASLYPYFDYSLGYGIPKASYFTDNKKNIHKTFSVEQKWDSFKIKIDTNKSTFNPNEYFYYHISNLNGKIYDYYVLKADTVYFDIDYSKYTKPFIFMAEYKGYTFKKEIK